MTNKLNVFIVEDDDNERNELVAEVNANSDRLCLVDALKSAGEALEIIRKQPPHVVILDLQLQEGEGDGLELLGKIRSTLLYPRPYVIVNTKNPSKITSDIAKKLGADYEFLKWQQGYTTKMVIEHLLMVMPAILDQKEASVPLTEQQLENKMREFVQDEFNKLGLSVKNIGYYYLVDAVVLAAMGDNHNWGKIIGKKYNKSESSVTHAMQYAIDNTWNKADINNLEKYYTAPLRKNEYKPTTAMFVFYYKQKLLRYFNK